MSRRQTLVILLLVLGAGHGSARQSDDPTSDLLRRYAAGDRSFVENPPQVVRHGVRRTHDDLKRLMPQLLASEPEARAAATRQLAAFALEVGGIGALNGQPEQSRDLIDWARDQLILSHRPPDEFDRHWHRLLIAVLQYARWLPQLEREVDLAVRQFPKEPRFVLARAFVAEERLLVSLDQGVPLEQSRLRDVRERLQDAAAFSEAQGEAELRLAYVLMRAGDYASALAHVGAAEQHIREPGLIYLARLFRGQAFGSLRRFDIADRSFEAALQIVPGAQTASLARASLCFQRGQRDRADAMVQSLLTRTSIAADPWWTYRTGDARLLPQLLQTLRGDVRP